MTTYGDLETLLRDMIGYVRSVGPDSVSIQVECVCVNEIEDGVGADEAHALYFTNTASSPVVTWEIPTDVLQQELSPEGAQQIDTPHGRQGFIRFIMHNASQGTIEATDDVAVRARVLREFVGLDYAQVENADASQGVVMNHVVTSMTRLEAPHQEPLMSWDRLLGRRA